MQEPTKAETATGFVPRLRGERAYYEPNPAHNAELPSLNHASIRWVGTLTGCLGMGRSFQLVLDYPAQAHPDHNPSPAPGEHRSWTFSIWLKFSSLHFLNQQANTERWCNDLVPCPTCGEHWRTPSNGQPTNMNHAPNCSTPNWGTPPNYHDLTPGQRGTGLHRPAAPLTNTNNTNN